MTKKKVTIVKKSGDKSRKQGKTDALKGILPSERIRESVNNNAEKSDSTENTGPRLKSDD